MNACANLAPLLFAQNATHKCVHTLTHACARTQVGAMREIEKETNSLVVKAKLDFKKSEEQLQKGKKEREKRLKASGAAGGGMGAGAVESDDEAIAELRSTLAASASHFVDTLNCDRKSKARLVAQVLYSKFEAELTCAIETHEVCMLSLSTRVGVVRSWWYVGDGGSSPRGEGGRGSVTWFEDEGIRVQCQRSEARG